MASNTNKQAKAAPDTTAAISLEEMQAAMLAEAEAKAAEILAAAEAKAKTILENAKGHGIENPKGAAKEEEEYVWVKLFKDNGKYKDDVFVSCNGENCVIKRGVRVRVKKCFAEILDNSEHQDYETSVMMDNMSHEFETNTAKLMGA